MSRALLITDQLVARAAAPDFADWWTQAAGTGFCARPIRLGAANHGDDVGVADEASGASGAVGHGPVGEGEPLLVACGNRRVSVCASCSATYRADTWQLVAAGLRGGKGVPEQVGEHPRLFVTLTAPSFGPVHSLRRRAGRSRVCRPLRAGQPRYCPHGRGLGCDRVHRAGEESVGSPLCVECFDYAGVVVWNALVPELWRRTTIYLRRTLARLAGVSVRALHEQVRLSFTKVAEYQARGCVHLHVVLRADGVDPSGTGAVVAPPSWCTPELLTAAVRQTVSVVTAPAPASARSGLVAARWGAQLDVRVVRAASALGNPVAVAAYVAKYATKAAETVTVGLERPIRSLADLAERRLPEHAHLLVQTCLLLHRDPQLDQLGLRRWAHMLGFGGHFSSRSRRYSVTLGALRAARQAFREARRQQPAARDWEPEGGWRFTGQGWRSAGEELLVATAARGRLQAAAEARDQRRTDQALLSAAA